MSVFQEKWKAAEPKAPSAILVNGWELAVSASRLCPGVPLAVALDTTPRLLLSQTRQLDTTLLKRVVAETAELVYSSLFKAMAPTVRAWLPMSTWCRDSLVRDYRVDSKLCQVTLSPQPIAPRKTEVDQESRPLRAVFVGNDFVRKGGQLLLELLRGSTRDIMHLTIVSNDPLVATMTDGLPVRIVSGLHSASEVQPYYLDADILLFPSLRDQFGHVVAEAMACGVVPLVSDVGGVRDMVIPGRTGVIMPFRSPALEWERAIRTLYSDRAHLALLSSGSRAYIQERMAISSLDHALYRTLDALGVTAKFHPPEHT
ncbi:MAG: glycosyltransferase family 4 protein [Gemmatimonadaceae bacterium]|nr:glycosyltransferase family 4 protein [Gemmatimonadaceae bacterium]